MKQELFKTQNSSKERKQESNIMIIQGGQSIHELPNNMQISSSRKEEVQQLTPNLNSQYYQGFRDESSPLTTNIDQQQPSPLNANYSQLTLNSNT